MIISNVKVYTEDQTFRDGDIAVQGDRFTDISGEAARTGKDATVDGGGCYAIPGLIDIHFHGCKGVDICDGTREAIAEIARYEASAGVTGICPATMTLPEEELIHILSVAASYKESEGEGDAQRADLLGINMEGPFISVEKKGAQDERNIISCDAGVCQKFLEASHGLVKFIGIAPEKNADALSFIQQMKSRVNISLALSLIHI